MYTLSMPNIFFYLIQMDLHVLLQIKLNLDSDPAQGLPTQDSLPT